MLSLFSNSTSCLWSVRNRGDVIENELLKIELLSFPLFLTAIRTPLVLKSLGDNWIGAKKRLVYIKHFRVTSNERQRKAEGCVKSRLEASCRYIYLIQFVVARGFAHYLFRCPHLVFFCEILNRWRVLLQKVIFWECLFCFYLLLSHILFLFSCQMFLK